MKTILVPVDLSPVTARVCDAACALAKLIDARIVLFHAEQLPPAMMNDYYAFDTGQMSEVIAAGKKHSSAKLRELAKKCSKSGQPVKTAQETGGSVATILDQAETLKADYIVIGSHGHTAVYDLLVGGTTHGVLRKARCPVLVVPMAPATPSRGRK